MNLVECYVTEIVGEPYFQSSFWFLQVKYNSYGSIGETTLFDKEKSSLESIDVGFMFHS